MSLKSPNGFYIYPFAFLPETFAKPGFLICTREGSGRFGHSLTELMTCNPKEEVYGHIKNLEPRFFKWLDQQQREIDPSSGSDIKDTDLLPFGATSRYQIPSPDTRTEDDYLQPLGMMVYKAGRR